MDASLTIFPFIPLLACHTDTFCSPAEIRRGDEGFLWTPTPIMETRFLVYTELEKSDYCTNLTVTQLLKCRKVRWLILPFLLSCSPSSSFTLPFPPVLMTLALLFSLWRSNTPSQTVFLLQFAPFCLILLSLSQPPPLLFLSLSLSLSLHDSFSSSLAGCNQTQQELISGCCCCCCCCCSHETLLLLPLYL